MNKHKQRMKIAEVCGWKDIRKCGKKSLKPHPEGAELRGTLDAPSANYPKEYSRLPDYLNDLNAMHEAEKVLTAKQSSAYWCILQSIGKPWPEKGKGAIFWQSTHATAAQRAEALLKTLNLWEVNK
jgi:hypothetical protein